MNWKSLKVTKYMHQDGSGAVLKGERTEDTVRKSNIQQLIGIPQKK